MAASLHAATAIVLTPSHWMEALVRNWISLTRLACAGLVPAMLVVSISVTPAQAREASEVGQEVGGERSAIIGTPTLTAQDIKALAEKDAVAAADWAALMEVRAAVESGDKITRLRLDSAGDKAVAPLDLPCVDGDCSWRTASRITQVAQSNGYYCGPAMLVSLVKVRNVSISQSTAASRLGTTTNGTDWYNGSTYPVRSALNYYLGSHGAVYAPIGLPGSPTSTQKSQYQSRLTSNVNRNWGIAGDAWEVHDGPRLNKHPNPPPGDDIFHWFAIRGYTEWGDKTNYADPAANASSLGWTSVPRYSTMSSNTIVTIMGGRGYIW